MTSEKDAIALLKEDHKKVKGLFDEFEKADSPAKKNKIIEQAIKELKVHATIEEEIFYPAVRPDLEEDLMNEADEEHHVARLLIAELDAGVNEDHRDAKFTVLAENVRHHIKEEESDMMPKVRKAKLDLVSLGKQLMERKAELLAGQLPVDAEHEMIENAQGDIDTPATEASGKRRNSRRAA